MFKKLFEKIKQENEAAAANYQHQENNIINEIKSNLSRDSSQGAKQNAAIKYSDWFYNQHGHDYSLHNQKTCAQKTIDIVGIDVNTAVEIQYRVIRAYTIAEGILDARETIQQHHLTTSSIINQQLTSQVQNLSINAPQVPTAESINSRHGGKVVGTSQIGVDQEGTSLAVNKAISDAKAFTNHCYNTLGNTRAINLSSSGVKDSDLSKFCTVIDSYKFNLEALYLNNNAIGNDGIAKLIPAITGNKYTVNRCFENGQSVSYFVAGDLRFVRNPDPQKIITQSVVFLNLADNNIGDRGAKTIADALMSGQLPATRAVDVSGNNITESGKDFFVKALNDPIVKRLAIIIDDLSHNLRIQSGRKEDVVPELQKILKSAKDRGVDVDNLVVDTSFMTWVKNIKGMLGIAHSGFIKCHWVDDPVGDYAKDNLCAKLPQKIGKFVKKAIDVEGIVSCFISASDQACTSEYGAQMAKTDLHVLGAEYIPEIIE